MKIRYFLSCEEWPPRELIDQAVQIGPNQDAFFDAYRERVLPRVR